MPDAAASAGTNPYESALLREVTGPALRPGGTILTDRAVSFCGFIQGCRLLDAGCGAGATVEHLVCRHGFDTIGLDQSRLLLDQAARRNPLLALVEGRADQLPFPAGSFDGIFCECVLSLLDAPRQVLAEFRRVLRPGGYLVLSDLYRRDERCPAPAGGAGVVGASAGALQGLVGESRFSVLLWEDHTRLLRELAARLVLAGCSLDGFCGRGCRESPLSAGTRPGYYLMVGRREG